MPDTASVLDEAARLDEALAIAMRALAWYADERHWLEDDWGVRGVIGFTDYGRPGHKARLAIKRVAALREAAAACRERNEER